MRLWVFNVDGILALNDGPVIEGMAKVIYDLQGQGDLCTVATDIDGMRVWQIMAPFQPNAPLIIAGGARIVSPAGQDVVVHPLAKRTLEALQRVLEEEPVALAVLTTISGNYRAFTSQRIVLPGRIRSVAEMTTQDPHVFITWAKAGCTSISLVADEEEELRSSPGVRWKRDGDHYVILARGVNKGTALLRLATIVGVALKDAFVVASDASDLPMFRLRDLGGKICVGDAYPELARRATHLIGSPKALAASLRRRYLQSQSP